MLGSPQDALDPRIDPAGPPATLDAPSSERGHRLRFAFWVLGLPLLFLAALTAIFRVTNADVVVSGLFYSGVHDAWPWQNAGASSVRCLATRPGDR